MVSSDPAKSRLKSAWCMVHGAWIDGYDSQKKEKNITITKNKSLLFFSVQCIIAKTMRFPTVLLLPSWMSF